MAVKIAVRHETDTEGRRRPVYEVRYEGAVLATRERNFYDDSDFYAVVWDDKEGRITTCEYATTRAWTYDNTAEVDATEEVKAKAQAWLRTWILERLRGASEYHAQRAEVGKRVRFIRTFNGRKQGRVEDGTEGTVARVADDTYTRYGGKERRLLLHLDDGRRVWVNRDYVEVVGWEGYLKPEEELEARADAWAAQDVWHAPVVDPGMAVL